MCTSLLLHSINKSIFGRNLDIDLEIDNKNIIISSRNSKLIFKNGEYINSHYAFMGIGILVNNYPLYFDGTNEFSLSVASLNFPVFGVLNNPLKSRLNLASYEIIPYILSKFKSVDEVKDNLKKLNITNIDFICGLKSVSLHYFVCDKTKSIVIEQTKDGVTIYDNPYHILTNSPTFAYHLQNIAQYLNISNKYPTNNFKNENLQPYCVGLNMIGIPGDYSSNSRFIKGAYLINTAKYDDESALYTHMHILDNLKMVKGIATSKDGHSEFTSYSCSVDLNDLCYYVRTYHSASYQKFDLFDKNLDLNSDKFYSFNF